VWMEWIESLKMGYGLFSVLDFCGSTVTCFNYRSEAQRLILGGDERLLVMYRTNLGFYAQTMLKCNFLQFGGTTVTALILGQAPSWLAGTHVFSAFLLAYWLVFCSPGDVWFQALSHTALLTPIKMTATISGAHALSSWGVDKALTAEHAKMRSSVWGALVCGFTSGCLGGLVAGVAEEGEGWVTSKAPTWPQQRTFYMVMLYYVVTDPHGVLNGLSQVSYHLVGFEGMTVFPVLAPSGCKVWLVILMLILQFSLDVTGVDLLQPLNQALGRIMAIVFPIRMQLRVGANKID